MSQKVIQVTNLGKQYRLGQVGATTISDDLKRFWYKIRGKDDPFLKIGEENDRTKKGGSEYVWALRDVSFNVYQGDVLGIVGKNGAGKSTLLKILSRTTVPTSGEYKIKGRVASLLEVGTGFHPDLTGRENVFLNGAILGMTKAEIKKNFDEILDFSGVERYIDTPVKRYSSGMYVRLAFAVAAHLKPEILIVDEVLSVGDQEFQDKCLGKMRSVSESGRTVLFVSHNLLAVKQLCTKGIYLKNGKLIKTGTTKDIVEEYLTDDRQLKNDGTIPLDFQREIGTGDAFFRKILLTDINDHPLSRLAINQPFKIKLHLEAVKQIKDVTININITTSLGEPIIFSVDSKDSKYLTRTFDEGMHEIEVMFDFKLLPNNYRVTIGVHYFKDGITIDWLENIYQFKIDKISYNTNEDYPWDTLHGYIEPESTWSYKKI